MKIYFVDKTGRNSIIRKYLEKNGAITVEVKDSLTFRSTKNDFVVLSEFNEREKSILLNKFQNLIIVTNNKEPKFIWEVIKEYKVIDVIDASLSPDYIANRILKIAS